MRIKITFLILIIVAIAGTSSISHAQQNEGVARDLFLSTRPSDQATVERKKTNLSKGKKPLTKPSNKTAKVGFGYSIYLRDENGKPVRVDPSREFRTGEAIRFTFESNIDGYLYIFHTEGESEPQMLFPDARLDKGRNSIRAHVPYELPSGFDQRAERQWFVVYGEKPVTERIYFVVSRQPLKGVLRGEELVNYCQSNLEDCVWRPSGTIWGQVRSKAGSPVIVSKNRSDGEAQSTVEKEAIGRGLTLVQNAPPPSVIRINNSPRAELLVTLIDLVHK
jgi:hypothetical protein